MSARSTVLGMLDAIGPAEPFRIKVVEPIPRSTVAERTAWLEEAGYNLFRVPAERVAVDLLTDSGTGAMSHHQWGALMQGDESYAGARSFHRFEATVQELFGLPHVIPTHQGRAAEHLLLGEIARPGTRVLSNTLFDTTHANAELAGARVVNLPCPEAADLARPGDFKGDVDLGRLEDALRDGASPVAAVVITATNNAGGGQPVSVANARATRALCQRAGVPVVLDACRIAENAYFVREREPGWQSATIPEIVRAFADCAAVVTMSAKKDGLANIGGFLALRDGELAERLRRRMVVTEGFPTYGGLAGRDMEAIAVGLREAMTPEYLAHRIGQVRFLADLLRGLGVPLVEPPGGHGVFVDAGAFLSHLPRAAFPGQALAVALYRQAGVRSCEIGSVMFGPEARHDLVRLAIPRRTYTTAHLASVARAFADLQSTATAIPGVRIVAAPPVLRHFTATFAPLTAPAESPAAVGRSTPDPAEARRGR